MSTRPITRVVVTKPDGKTVDFIGWKAATKAVGLGRARITGIANAGGFLPNGDKVTINREHMPAAKLGRPIDNVKVRINPEHVDAVAKRASAVGIPPRQLLTQIVAEAVATYLQRLQASPSAAA